MSLPHPPSFQLNAHGLHLRMLWFMEPIVGASGLPSTGGLASTGWTAWLQDVGVTIGDTTASALPDALAAATAAAAADTTAVAASHHGQDAVLAGELAPGATSSSPPCTRCEGPDEELVLRCTCELLFNVGVLRVLRGVSEPAPRFAAESPRGRRSSGFMISSAPSTPLQGADRTLRSSTKSSKEDGRSI